MHLTIIAVGKLKERFWVDACDEYLKRLSKYAVVKVHEIADQDPVKSGGEGAALDREGDMLLNAIEKHNCDEVVLLDVKGRPMSSEAIAQDIETAAINGKSRIALVIGSSCGVSEKVSNRATAKWSFGKITLPHNLARVVLLEQLFRAFKINRGEPYHK